jgi:hypothetical protein
MDNDDESLFGSPKSILGFLFFGFITLYFIYWIYNNIFKDDHNQNLNVNNRIINAVPINANQKKVKQKLSINMTMLMKDSKSTTLFDIDYLYDIFDKLSDHYNLYLLILIEDTINAEKIKDNIIKYLEPIISDNIVYEHRIIFCTSIEGMSAIIRSLDPFIHIENNNYFVVNLIRYINEFWFVKAQDEKGDIEKKIGADTNNANQNIGLLMDKVKFFSSFNDLFNKLKI